MKILSKGLFSVHDVLNWLAIKVWESLMARTKVRKKKNIKGFDRFTEKIKKVVLGTSISHPSKVRSY